MPKIKKYTMLESWPMIREDFEEFIKDSTCWFMNNMEKALANADLKSANNLMEIFKIVHAPSSNHSH